MRQLAKLSVIAVTISTMSGCGWLWGDKGYFRNRSNDYLDAKQAPLIVIPANLQENTRPFDPLYPIPNNIPNSTAGKNFQVPRPVPLQIVNNNKTFSLQRTQGKQWFIAQQTPSQVYGQTLQYFRQAGFAIETNQPETGEFTTAWVEPNTLNSMLANRLLAIDTTMVNQAFRVRTRIEPGVNANTSEVYTVVMVRPKGATENSAEIAWPATSQNTAVESVLLDELMANMSNAQSSESTVLLVSDDQQLATKAKSESALLKRDSQNIPILVMNGDLDLAWGRIERAINAANIKIDDMDRSLGAYYINLAEKADGSSEVGFFSRLFGGDSEAKREAKAERYIIKVTPINNEIDVRVQGIKDNTIATEKAEIILKQLQDNMN